MFPTDPEEVQDEVVENDVEEVIQDEPADAVVEAAEAADEVVAEERAEAVEADPLAQIEERVLRAVELVNALRGERDAALREVAQLRSQLTQGTAASRSLSEEIEALKTERKQVRSRLERLLGHIDQLN